MIIKVAALQYPLGQEITLEDKLFLIRRRPDFVCLPEYYFVRKDCGGVEDAASGARANIQTIKKLSVDLATTVVGGSMIAQTKRGYANTTMIFSRGRLIGSYQKINLSGNEPRRGIVSGKRVMVFEVGGVRVGVLICADVLDPQLFKKLKKQQVDVIFVPTASPHRPNDTHFDKQLRDNTIFVHGAQLANAYVIKAGGVGTLFGSRLQGRSAVFAPWGILAKTAVDDENCKRILITILDLTEIREFKEKMVYSVGAMIEEK